MGASNFWIFHYGSKSSFNLQEPVGLKERRLQIACQTPYCFGPMKSKFPFGLSLSKPFDRLRANGSYFTGPDQ